jgi:hypothetical protein
MYAQIKAVLEFLGADANSINAHVDVFFQHASVSGKQHGLDLDEVYICVFFFFFFSLVMLFFFSALDGH